MEYKNDVSNINVIKKIIPFHPSGTSEEIYVPEVFIDPGFVDFPQLATLNFKKRSAFEILFDSNFPLFLVSFMKDSFDKEMSSQNQFTFMFPKNKSKTSQIQAAAEAAVLISASPSDLLNRMVGTGFFEGLVHFLSVKDSTVIKYVLNCIIYIMKTDEEETLKEMIETLSVHKAVYEIVANTKDIEIKSLGVNTLTHIIEHNIGQEDTIIILRFMNNLAAQYHEIFNSYLIIAYHNISMYAMDFFDHMKLYEKMLIFMCQPDPLLCKVSADTLIGYIKYYGADCIPKLMNERNNIASCIEIAISKVAGNSKAIRSVINLFTVLLECEPSLINIDNNKDAKPVMHIILGRMCEILQNGARQIKDNVVEAFAHLLGSVGIIIMDMLPTELPDEQDAFTDLVNSFGSISEETLHILLVKLAEYIQNRPEASEKYGEEFLEALCDIVDNSDNQEISQLAFDIRDSVFPPEED